MGLLRRAVDRRPDEDPLRVAFLLGKACGYDDAGRMVAKAFAARRPDEPITYEELRHALEHVADAADGSAMEIITAEVPSREERLATRPWLRP